MAKCNVVTKSDVDRSLREVCGLDCVDSNFCEHHANPKNHAKKTCQVAKRGMPNYCNEVGYVEKPGDICYCLKHWLAILATIAAKRTCAMTKISDVSDKLVKCNAPKENGSTFCFRHNGIKCVYARRGMRCCDDKLHNEKFCESHRSQVRTSRGPAPPKPHRLAR